MVITPTYKNITIHINNKTKGKNFTVKFYKRVKKESY